MLAGGTFVGVREPKYELGEELKLMFFRTEGKEGGTDRALVAAPEAGLGRYQGVT